MKALLLIALLCITVLSDSCGGNCPSGKCPTCYCGTAKNVVNIAEWCGKFNWNQACCQCIVSHESGGNAHALNFNPSPPTTDVGLWQINTQNWGQCNGGNAPCDTNQNLECAKKVYAWGGNSWRLWSTHTGCGC